MNSQNEIKEIPVYFEIGSSSAVVEGEIVRYNSVDYTLVAKARQTMSVLLETDHSASYFNILPPNSQTAIFIGQVSGNEWSGILPQDGKYSVRVYLMRDAARRNEKANFTLEVSITGSASEQDAKVAGTNFHATGQIPCSVGLDPKRSASCDFEVIRSGQGNAEVQTSTPRRRKTSPDPSGRFGKRQG